jgi:cytohesin
LVLGVFLLASAGADDSSKTTTLKAELFRAISIGDQAEAVRIVAAGIDPNVRRTLALQLTALHRAAEQGLGDVVRALVAKGAKLDIEAQFFRGTPLVVALANGHEDVARFLVVSGANAAIVDSAGYTPLHVAAGSSSTEILELLIAKRANVNARSKIGRTPLYNAIAGERWNNATFLIARGANIHSDIGEVQR